MCLLCLRKLRDLGFARADIDVSYQSSWQLPAAGLAQVSVRQSLRRAGPALELPAPLDYPEQIYSADIWELLVHLHKSGWTMATVAGGRRKQSSELPDYIAGGVKNMYIQNNARQQNQSRLPDPAGFYRTA